MNGREKATHCLNGHEYSKQNTRNSVRGNGKTRRTCRACERLRVNKSKSKQSPEQFLKTVAARDERRASRMDVRVTPLGKHEGQKCPREHCTGTLFINMDKDLQCISCERSVSAILVEPKKPRKKKVK